MRHGFAIDSVQVPVIRSVGEWTRNTPGVLSLGQGMVAYPPPEEALQAIAGFGSVPDQHFYHSALGYRPLLDAIEKKLGEENRIDVVSSYRVMVTAGANMAFLTALMAICDPGDEVILPLPYYFNQEMAVRMLNCRPVMVPTDSHYQLQMDLLEAAISAKTRAIVTISPNNPTGAVYPEADLAAVNELCRRHEIYHISDEAYEYFTYGNVRHFSPGSLPGSSGHTISLFSLSKAYGFASWRIGYMVFPEALLTPLLKVQDTNLICPPTITQMAATGAMAEGYSYCRRHLPDLAAVRGFMLGRLEQLHDFCDVVATDGAFYLLVGLHTEQKDMAVVKTLIERFKVAAIPGCAFGLDHGCYLRLSYGMLDRSRAETAMARLCDGIRHLS